jgi:hypothetical protein
MVQLIIAFRLQVLAVISKCLLRNLQGLRDEVVLQVVTGPSSRLQDLITTEGRRNITNARNPEKVMSPENARRGERIGHELQ